MSDKIEWRIYRTYYLVSNRGDVMSLRSSEPRFMTQHVDADGYYRAVLALSNARKNCRVHRLVAELFLPVPLPGQELVNHKDGNKRNNRVSNLEWVTYSQNLKHAYDTGLR